MDNLKLGTKKNDPESQHYKSQQHGWKTEQGAFHIRRRPYLTNKYSNCLLFEKLIVSLGP